MVGLEIIVGLNFCKTFLLFHFLSQGPQLVGVNHHIEELNNLGHRHGS